MSDGSTGMPDADFISSLIDAAYHRIQPHVIKTPIRADDDGALHFKCENLQNTGSFKWRGALSKLSVLSNGSNIVTASTGNHGLGVVHAAKLFDHKVKVFIPATASPKKKENLLALGIDLVQIDGDSLAAELAGKKFADQHDAVWVSPYNDPEVIAGQGTIGLEIFNQMDRVDTLYVTVGGGGLISGIAAWCKSHAPDTEVVGCQPVNSPEMYLSQLAGHVVMAPEELPTLSDGSAGPLEEDSITFDLCRKLVDRYILIPEDEIRTAIRHMYADHGLVIEGAAGVAVAAATKDGHRKEKVVVVLCGGNIDPRIHQEICSP